ncbi:superoxide dismutase [Lapidilactobacillus achengensis]|uniref:Superoxide dismutase n=1 Tax=Lapidilactobacillus achengensis TaxID=2486000 RepID=A0ABW1URW6_9LACO|nr:superoxide dismutase [Lapidilactobacillus achengensis]
MKFQLAPLPYAYAALEPVVDRETMQLHHDRHHAAYVNNLNQAIAKVGGIWATRSLPELLLDLSALPVSIRELVRNNGGGHLNHTLFWQMLQPGGVTNKPAELTTVIQQQFGGWSQLKEQIITAGLGRFGSGWVWLAQDELGHLQILTTANQDNPLSSGWHPVLGLDLWEHAYYLQYHQQRAIYLENLWQIIDWKFVQRLWLDPTRVQHIIY